MNDAWNESVVRCALLAVCALSRILSACDSWNGAFHTCVCCRVHMPPPRMLDSVVACSQMHLQHSICLRSHFQRSSYALSLCQLVRVVCARSLLWMCVHSPFGCSFSFIHLRLNCCPAERLSASLSVIVCFHPFTSNYSVITHNQRT